MPTIKPFFWVLFSATVNAGKLNFPYFFYIFFLSVYNSAQKHKLETSEALNINSGNYWPG